MLLGAGLLIVIALWGFLFSKKTLSAIDITADNYRGLLREGSASIEEGDISGNTLHSLNVLRANEFEEKENGTVTIEKQVADNVLYVQHKSKTNYLQTASVWQGKRYDKLQQFSVHDYYWFGHTLPTTSPQLAKIVELLILKEGFTRKETEFKRGLDILLKETKDKFIVVEIHPDRSINGIFDLKFLAFSKRKH